MTDTTSVEQLFEILISGDRPAARQYIEGVLARGATAESLVTGLFWPTYELIERLFRQDQLCTMSHHFAMRLLRVLVDQNAGRLSFEPSRGKTVLVACGSNEACDMGAQMAVDLLECAGFTVQFAGGGIAGDEILGRVNETKPDVLLMFCSAPTDLPDIRQLIDTIREINACPHLQIAVGGGVFNRAEGLAEEIGADVWSKTPLDMVETIIAEPERRATASQRTVGKNQRKPSSATGSQRAAA
ncbi:MAG: cobalamin B12-binding domain-containing protein [Phycisphaerae bacterium]|nr:cobalamin B12-binding domain-containing protein [Phycisphaerae bacterium]